jgi:hypothetical protein
MALLFHRPIKHRSKTNIEIKALSVQQLMYCLNGKFESQVAVSVFEHPTPICP